MAHAEHSQGMPRDEPNVDDLTFFMCSVRDKPNMVAYAYVYVYVQWVCTGKMP